MVTRKLTSVLLAAVIGLHAVPAAADVIELRADHWCPFNCDPDAERPGFMVEIAREALGQFGHGVNYQTLNWTRSLDYARTGRIDGVIGTDPDEAPELVFGPPLGTYQEAMAFRPGEMRALESPEAMEGLRLGAISEYNYNTAAIGEYIEARSGDAIHVQLLSGENALVQNLRKLAAGRVDVVPEDHSVLRYTLANLGMQNAFEIALDDEISELFIAFSPERETSALYAAQLSEGLEHLRATGRLDQILARYGLSD